MWYRPPRWVELSWMFCLHEKFSITNRVATVLYLTNWAFNDWLTIWVNSIEHEQNIQDKLHLKKNTWTWEASVCVWPQQVVFIALRKKHLFQGMNDCLECFLLLNDSSHASWIRRRCSQTRSQMSGQKQARLLLLQKVQMFYLGILVGEAPRLNMDAWGLSPTSSLLLNVGAHSTVDIILASCLVTWVRFSVFSIFSNEKFSQNF